MVETVSVDNAQVQTILGEALEKLSILTAVTTLEPLLQAQVDVLRLTLATVKLYSASGNSIPGLRGRGLAEALALADEVIASGFDLHERRLNLATLGLSLGKSKP